MVLWFKFLDCWFCWILLLYKYVFLYVGWNIFDIKNFEKYIFLKMFIGKIVSLKNVLYVLVVVGV